MAEKQVRIDLVATDHASGKVDDVADAVEDLERTDPEVEVTADTSKAERNLEDVSDAVRAITRQDAEVVLRGKVDDLRGALKGAQTDLDAVTGKAQTTRKAVDDIGGSTGPRLAGNTVADLTGPLGEASGAASDLGGVFDGLSDITEGAFARMGHAALGATLSTAMGGLGLAAAGLAAGVAYFSGKAKKAAEEQKRLLENQTKINKALKEGDAVAAAVDFESTYKDALRAGQDLGFTVEETTRIISGQSDAVHQLDLRYADAQSTIAEYAASEATAVKSAEDWKRLEMAQEFVHVHDTLAAGKKTWDDQNGAYADAEDLSAGVARGLEGITGASSDLEAQQKRTAERSEDLRDALDKVRGALSMERAIIRFRDTMATAMEKTDEHTQATEEEILDLKEAVLDVAEFAELNPAEVKTMLDKIDAGDMAGVAADVERYYQRDPASVRTILHAPTDAELAAMVSATRRRLSAAAAAAGLASGVVGVPSMAPAPASVVNVTQNVPRGYRGDLVAAAYAQTRRHGRLYQRAGR